VNKTVIHQASDDVFAAYSQNVDKVPDSIVDNAIFTENEDQARAFATAFQEGRKKDYTKLPTSSQRGELIISSSILKKHS
jgi:hypothetical protein